MRAPAKVFAPSHDETGQAARIPVRSLLLVGALSAFAPLCIDLYLPAFPEIGTDLHASASAVQASLTACLVGLAMGQVIVGPISDRFGRRPPLFAGILAFVVASVACAFAPGILVLIGLRFIQGLGGSAGVVIARAIVRDLYAGSTAARFFSLLMLVTGATPILAPQLGAGLLNLGSWRVLFGVLAVIGLALLINAVLRLPETLPVEKRSAGGFTATARTLHLVLTDRNFIVNALSCGLGFGAIFAYISGSSFALQNVYGLSPQEFGLAFAGNAVGLVAGSQVNGRLVGRYGSRHLLTVGVIGLALGGVSLLVVIAAGWFGLAGVLVCLFVVIFSAGFVGPNGMALALNDFPESAGSAAALVGVLQYALGAIVAPLVGLGGTHDALPMGIVLATCGVLAVGLRFAQRA